MKEFSVDRFEEGAVIIISEDEVRTLPRAALPKGLEEGDVLLFDGKSYRKSSSLTEKKRKEAKQLIDDLFV